MSVDVSSKQANWLARLVQDAMTAVDAIDRASRTAREYSDNAFNGGDPVNRPEYAITDAMLAASNFTHLDATKLNALIGGLDAIAAAKAAHAGVLEAARP